MKCFGKCLLSYFPPATDGWVFELIYMRGKKIFLKFLLFVKIKSMKEIMKKTEKNKLCTLLLNITCINLRLSYILLMILTYFYPNKVLNVWFLLLSIYSQWSINTFTSVSDQNTSFTLPNNTTEWDVKEQFDNHKTC